jgi:hypothetical protein
VTAAIALTNDCNDTQWFHRLARAARTIEARGFRVECGALVLVQPLGCAAAYGPSTWLAIEELNTEG